jgi:serine/threonine-protein kinase
MRVDAKVMRVEVKGRQESSVLTWTGLIVAGAGLVGVGAGTYYGVRARQNWSQVEGIHQDSLDWGDREQEYWDDAEAQERRAKVLLGVGAATVIVGGVLYVLGARSGGDTSMSASASPGGAVVGVSGAF